MLPFLVEVLLLLQDIVSLLEKTVNFVLPLVDQQLSLHLLFLLGEVHQPLVLNFLKLFLSLLLLSLLLFLLVVQHDLHHNSLFLIVPSLLVEPPLHQVLLNASQSNQIPFFLSMLFL